MLPRFHEQVNMLILRVGVSIREESLCNCYIKAFVLQMLHKSIVVAGRGGARHCVALQLFQLVDHEHKLQREDGSRLEFGGLGLGSE